MKEEEIDILRKMNLSGPVMMQIKICRAILEGKTKETIAEDFKVTLSYVYTVQREKCPSCNPNQKV